MSNLKFFIVASHILTQTASLCTAQTQYRSNTIRGYELQISNIKFDSATGDVYSIPLRRYGLLKSNYSVIVSATLKDDSTEYHIPGLIASRDQLSFILKNGRNHVGDTLKIIRKTGEKTIVFSKIKVVAFRGVNRRNILHYDKVFTQFVLNKYFHSSPQLLRLSADYYVPDNH